MIIITEIISLDQQLEVYGVCNILKSDPVFFRDEI